MSLLLIHLLSVSMSTSTFLPSRCVIEAMNAFVCVYKNTSLKPLQNYYHIYSMSWKSENIATLIPTYTSYSSYFYVNLARQTNYLLLFFFSCIWVSLSAREEKMAWKRREIQNSSLSSPSTCCWKVSERLSPMCRTLSSSKNTQPGSHTVYTHPH